MPGTPGCLRIRDADRHEHRRHDEAGDDVVPQPGRLVLAQRVQTREASASSRFDSSASGGRYGQARRYPLRAFQSVGAAQTYAWPYASWLTDCDR